MLIFHAGRRLGLVALFSLALLYFLFSRSESLVPAWSQGCTSNRNNLYGIKAPAPLDAAYAAGLWSDLHALFDAHPPSPAHLAQPHHASDLGFPTKEKLGTFFNLTQAQAKATREGHRQVMEALPSYPNDQFGGRGVVMLAGARYAEFAATSLGMLRDMGSRLPVEIWAKDEKEELSGWCAELETEGIACRRLVDHMDMSALKHPYQWKVFTLLFSSFREILFLDADDMPVRNPDDVFESEAYQSTGAVLWPDYWKHSGSPWAPYIVGLSDKASDMLMDDRSVESGQIIWDKARHWKSLLLAAFYNYYGPDYYYTVFNNGWAGWGDKDTFPVALKTAREPYHHIPNDILTLFVPGTLLGIGMVQSAPSNDTPEPKALSSDVTAHVPAPAHAPPGDPLFLHSNIVKWSMRNFLCDPEHCAPLFPGSPVILHRVDAGSPIHAHLKDGRRVFSPDALAGLGSDPEPAMWKAFEHTACRSRAWRDATLCNRAREHMRQAFGFKFEQQGMIGSRRTCVMDPPKAA